MFSCFPNRNLVQISGNGICLADRSSHYTTLTMWSSEDEAWINKTQDKNINKLVIQGIAFNTFEVSKISVIANQTPIPKPLAISIINEVTARNAEAIAKLVTTNGLGFVIAYQD